MNQIHWISVKSVSDEDALAIERWQGVHGGVTLQGGNNGKRVYTAPPQGSASPHFPFHLTPAAAVAPVVPEPPKVSKVYTAPMHGLGSPSFPFRLALPTNTFEGWNWASVHPAAVGSTPLSSPHPASPSPSTPARTPQKAAASPSSMSSSSASSASSASSVSSVPVPAPVSTPAIVPPIPAPLVPAPLVPAARTLHAGADKDVRKKSPAKKLKQARTPRGRRSPSKSRSPSSRRRSPSAKARSPSSRRQSPSAKARSPSSRRQSPSAKAQSPASRRRSRGVRQFYQVDRHGMCMSPSQKYTLDAEGAPIDVVKQIIQAQKHKRARKRTDGDGGAEPVLIPASVQKAVEQAVRQNFMCTCPYGASHCTDAVACRHRSTKQGSVYLNKYMRDAPHVFLDSITIYLREDGKPTMREYAGGYRLINNPSKACIKQGVNKEVVARYVATHKVDDMF